MKLLISILPIALTLSSLCGCQSESGSSSGDVMTSNDVVKAPSDLKAEPLDGGAHLTWKDNSDNEAEFMIERKMMGGGLEDRWYGPCQHHFAPRSKSHD